MGADPPTPPPPRPPLQGVRGLLRQSGTTSVAAAAGVASGLVLDAAILAAVGASAVGDAFFAAATIMLAIVSIVTVAANQALVPAISTWLVEKGEPESWRLTSATLHLTAALGVLLVAVTIPLAEPLMALTLPGVDEATVGEAAAAVRVLMPVIPLVALTEILRALLNARHRFAAPAAMHVVMNGVAAALVVAATSPDAVTISWAYVAGAAAQLLFIVAMALRAGWRWRPVWAVRDPAIRAVGALVVRPLAGASLNPLARVGELLFVSFLPAGSITIMRTGYRLVSAIGGTVLFRSVMVVLLPRLTRATARRDDVETRQLTRLGFRILLVISVGLTAVMAVLATPATLALFGRGKFSAEDAALLGVTLAVYALSLPGSGIQRALLAPFFARLDTRVPFRNTVYGVVANLALVPVCIAPFGNSADAVIGVAVAYSLAQYVNVAHAWARLRGIDLQPRGVRSMLLPLLVAAAASIVVMVGGVYLLELGEETRRGVLLLETGLLAVAGVAVFAGVALLLGLDDVRRLRGDGSPPVPAEDPPPSEG
ncbi:MAG TPA: lipid II flippase MurJ [Actinomycetota bacterium]